jgi:excisionase family DNA binding protein
MPAISANARTGRGQMLTVPDVAKILGCGTSLIYGFMDSGHLKSIRFPTGGRRIPRQALKDFIAEAGRAGAIPGKRWRGGKRLNGKQAG